jgi:hypothetical protein
MDNKNNAMRGGEEEFMESVIDDENTGLQATSAVIFTPRQQKHSSLPHQPH